MTPVLAAVGGRAQHLDGQRAGGVVGGGERMRGRQAAGDHRRPSGLRLTRARPATNSEPRPRSTPSESQITSMPGVAASRRLIVGSASTRSMACGLGLICFEPHARGGRQLQRDVARGLAERHERDAAVVGLGARDDVVGGAHARVPARRRAKAVVDQERDRRGAGRGRDRRIPQRAGGGDDHQRRERRAAAASATTACAPACPPSA